MRGSPSHLESGCHASVADSPPGRDFAPEQITTRGTSEPVTEDPGAQQIEVAEQELIK
ncbi:hypothetical protein ACJX0J_037407, partial [Zea mays]